MVDIEQLKPEWHDYRTDVPSWILEGVGQVAVEWAVLERELEELIRLLMDVRIEYGRIVVNRMTAKIRAATAQHLIQVRILDSKLTRTHLRTFTKLADKIDALQTKRDILAHGLWGELHGNWCTLLMRKLRKTPELEPDLEKLNRAVLPQRDNISPDRLLNDAREIAEAAQSIVSFCSTLETALQPLINSPPTYTRQRRVYS